MERQIQTDRYRESEIEIQRQKDRLYGRKVKQESEKDLERQRETEREREIGREWKIQLVEEVKGGRDREMKVQKEEEIERCRQKK